MGMMMETKPLKTLRKLCKELRCPRGKENVIYGGIFMQRNNVVNKKWPSVISRDTVEHS